MKGKVAIVELEEAVHCEMPVEVTFERLTDEITLPKFKPLAKGGATDA